MCNNTSVSILVPVYGVEKFIERCARSLFEQTYEHLEYIFVNDCTKDSSITILKDVIERYPNRKPHVRIIEHKHNKGLGGARNTAVTAATGEFLIHVDSDDYIDTTCIEKCVLKQKETDADVVSVDILRFGGVRVITHKIPDFKTPKELNLAVIKHTIPNNIWGRLIRTSLYKDNQIKVTEGVNMSEDINVLPRLLWYAKKIANVPEVLCFYDCSNINSYTSSFSESKCIQGKISREVLNHFFEGKDKEIEKALKYRATISIVRALIDCTKYGNHTDFYKKLRSELKLYINQEIIKELSIADRISVLCSNYNLFRIYVKIASYIKEKTR